MPSTSGLHRQTVANQCVIVTARYIELTLVLESAPNALHHSVRDLGRGMNKMEVLATLSLEHHMQMFGQTGSNGICQNTPVSPTIRG